MKRGRKPKIGIYHAESSVRSFSIKIYVEQIKGYTEFYNELVELQESLKAS